MLYTFRLFVVLALAFLFSGCSVFGIRSGTPEVPFTILDKVDDVEIRSYESRLVAEVAEAKDSSEAFYLLFDYISGENVDKQSISMTAPVELGKTGEKIQMTAPVEVRNETQQKVSMKFFLPKDFTTLNAPTPKNPRVKILELPAELYAAVRYSGVSTDTDVEEMRQKIEQTLKDTKWKSEGPPLYFGYDPPFTIPFLRRNEVMIKVQAGY